LPSLTDRTSDEPSGDRRDFATRFFEQLRVVRDNLLLILVCIALTTGAAVAYSLLSTPIYAADAKLLVRQDDLGASLLDTGQATTEDPVRAAATDLEFASLPSIAARVNDELRLGETPEELLERVEAEAEGESNILSITVEDPSAAGAARIANSFAREYVDFRRASDRRRYTRALSLVRSRIARSESLGTSSAEVNALEDQARQLELLASLQTGDAELIQPADVPESPARPLPVRNGALGLLVGLLLGVAIAVLRDRLDRRIKKEEDVRSLLPGIPVIATVPQEGVRGQDPTPRIEAFRTLQTNLGFLNVDRALDSLLITSAVAEEGKSTTALYLSLAMAERKRAVVLVEADMRKPGLSRLLDLLGVPGVSNFLSGGGPLNQYVQQLPGGRSRDGDGSVAVATSTVAIIPAGPTPPNPQALLTTSALDDLLAQAADLSDTVIVDGTPLGPFSDMLPVARRVDGVILTVRLYHSRRDEVLRLVEQLAQASIQPLGVVVLGTKKRAAQTYYYGRG
jgi:receptor protein-tyrosine kinase